MGSNGIVKKTALLKFAAIIVICVLLDITLHMVTGPYSTMPEAPDYNKLAELLGTEVTATLWALLAFSSVACVFYRSQHSIPGAGFKKDCGMEVRSHCSGWLPCWREFLCLAIR